jgi:hypothetical protein
MISSWATCCLALLAVLATTAGPGAEATGVGTCSNASKPEYPSPEVRAMQGIERLAWVWEDPNATSSGIRPWANKGGLKLWDGDTSAPSYLSSLIIMPGVVLLAGLVLLCCVDCVVISKPSHTPYALLVAVVVVLFAIALIFASVFLVGYTEANKGLDDVAKGAEDLQTVAQVLSRTLWSMTNDTAILSDVLNTTDCFGDDAASREYVQKLAADVEYISGTLGELGDLAGKLSYLHEMQLDPLALSCLVSYPAKIVLMCIYLQGSISEFLLNLLDAAETYDFVSPIVVYSLFAITLATLIVLAASIISTSVRKPWRMGGRVCLGCCDNLAAVLFLLVSVAFMISLVSII